MKFKVGKNKVTLVDPEIVNAGEYRVTSCEFEFTPEYEDLAEKAIFTILQTGEAIETPILENRCEIPADVLRERSDVMIGVIGYAIDEAGKLALRYSPTPARIRIAPGSYRECARNPSEVTKSQSDIYEAMVQEAVSEAEDVVDDVRDRLESGEFKGEPGPAGEDGFSPTATVTQEGNGARIEITDKNGTTTARVEGGSDDPTEEYTDDEWLALWASEKSLRAINKRKGI